MTAPVAGASSADTAALWLQFRVQLRAFVARRLSNAADVDDVVQWVFLRLHQNLGRLRDSERVDAWLYRTARRAIADYYRAKARNREVLSGGASDLDALATSTDPGRGDLQDVSRCLAPLVAQLPVPYREAIQLADLQGVRLADAAETAGISLSGMKARVQRGRKRLHRMLAACCEIEVDSRSGARSCEERRTAAVCCRRTVQ